MQSVCARTGGPERVCEAGGQWEFGGFGPKMSSGEVGGGAAQRLWPHGKGCFEDTGVHAKGCRSLQFFLPHI